MSSKIVKSVNRGVEVEEQVTPTGYVEIATERPHSGIWDIQGREFQQKVIAVLLAAGVHGIPLETRHRIVSPQGTGPGGMIRFGDDMMPGIYRVAVHEKDVAAAHKALARWQEAIHRWLYEGWPEPQIDHKSTTGYKCEACNYPIRYSPTLAAGKRIRNCCGKVARMIKDYDAGPLWYFKPKLTSSWHLLRPCSSKAYCGARLSSHTPTMDQPSADNLCSNCHWGARRRRPEGTRLFKE